MGWGPVDWVERVLPEAKLKNTTTLLFEIFRFERPIPRYLLKTVLPCKALGFSYGLITAVSRRSSCWNLRGTKSSGSGRQRRTVAESCGELRRVATVDSPSTGSTDLGCTINISKAALCVDITFGNSFAQSPCSRFKLPLATNSKSEKQATGWQLGECAPVILGSFD